MRLAITALFGENLRDTHRGREGRIAFVNYSPGFDPRSHGSCLKEGIAGVCVTWAKNLLLLRRVAG